MPTFLNSILLLAVAACAATAEVSVGSGDVVPSEVFSRMRGGATSSGPRGMRRVDAMVEPAAFHSLGLSAPLPPPKPLVDAAREVIEEPPPSELKLATPDSATVTHLVAEPQPLATQPDTIPIDAPAAATPPPNPAPPRPETPPRVASRSEDSPGRLLGALSAPAKPVDGPRLGLPSNPFDAVMQWRPSSRQMTATGAGMAITVGLLLSFVWLLRSMAPKSSRPLPREVVEVLGRAPLAGKQTTQLLRVGHKLVLVAITPDGAETLTEITDPDEVARLVAACDASGGRGSTAEFDALLRQMEGQRVKSGFLDSRDDYSNRNYSYEDNSFDPRSLAAAYANTPGGRGDG